jgi:DNA polymerase III subunit gamma/tau
MSTVVLARKYRPRSFAQMAGQEHVVKALGNALGQQRLHHAYLFTGTRGIGKTTVSRILAKSLNCTGVDGQGDITPEPCGQCQACIDIDNDRFIDYIEMDAASNRGIDEVRDMIERAAYKPSVGRFKVFMIDEAHQLTKEAFNALLKTLEEPPAYLKFVLATTDPEKMLPTVLSRCLQFSLRPMSPETVRVHLGQVLQAEGVVHDDGALRLLSRAARGSMRDALSLTDQAIAYGGGRFDESVVRAMLGLSDTHVAFNLLQLLAARDGAQLLAHVQSLREAGVSWDATLEQMALLLQKVAVEQTVPQALSADDADAAAAQTLSGVMTPEEVQLLYSLLLQGRGELSLLSDTGAAFSMVLLRYLAFPPVASAVPPAQPGAKAAPLRVPSAVQRLTVPVPRAAATPLPVAPAPAPAGSSPRPLVPAQDTSVPVQAEALAPSSAGAERAASRAGSTQPAASPTPADPVLADAWDTQVRALAQRGLLAGLVKELAWQSAALAHAAAPEEQWTLCTEHDALRSVALKDKLAAALSTLAERPVQVQVTAGLPVDTPALRDAAERTRRQQAAERSIHEDPVVRDLLAQYSGARIVPGSIKPL